MATVKVEFEFDTDELDITPIEGVAVLYAYSKDSDPLVVYGAYGEPSSLAAIGLYHVALRNAEAGFDSDED